MLYSNKNYKIVEKEMSFGKVKGISLGESGRGRREIFLPVPGSFDNDIANGIMPDLTIGKSKSGRPRIYFSEYENAEDDIYLILSSERNYTRRGCGVIKVPAKQEIRLVAIGNGADGDAGRIGTWDVVVVNGKEGDVFRVIWGGHGYGYSPTFYVVHNNSVYMAEQPDVEDLYEQLGLDMPFSLRFEDDGYYINEGEWTTI